MNDSFNHSGNGTPLDNAGDFVPFSEAARLLVVDDEESLRITTAAIFEKEWRLDPRTAIGSRIELGNLWAQHVHRDLVAATVDVGDRCGLREPAATRHLPGARRLPHAPERRAPARPAVRA